MAWPFSEVDISFRSGMVEMSTAPPLVFGDTLRFQLLPEWDGGLGGTFWGGSVRRVVLWKASMWRAGENVVLKTVQVTDDLGNVYSLPFDVRVNPGVGNLVLRTEWRKPPGTAVEFGEFEFFEAARPGSSQLTADALDFDGSVLDSATLEVPINRFPLRLTAPPTQSVRVSEQIAPTLVVPLPKGQVFSTAQPFWTQLILPEDRRSLTIGNLSIGFRKMPFSLRVVVETPEDAVNGVFFQHPEPAHNVTLDADYEFTSLPPYVVGRKVGMAAIAVEIAVHDTALYEAPDQPHRFTIDVLEQPIEFELKPLTGDPPLLLEDDWRQNEAPAGALRGTISVVVKRNGVEMYDSSMQTEIYAASYGSDRLSIHKIKRRYDGGDERATDRFLTSIAFDLVVADPDKLALDMRHQGAATPLVWNGRHTLHDCVRALYFGDSELRLEPLEPSPLDPTAVFFKLPTEAPKLAVKIPHPLRARLISWSDVHFNGSTAVPLDAGNPSDELIYSTGTLVAELEEHNPASSSERIETIVAPPGRPDVYTLLENGTHILDNGDIRVELEGLAYDEGNGDGRNTVTLSAWKPINQVVYGGADEDDVDLTAVKPRSVEILEPADGITVRRRRLANVRYTCARTSRVSMSDPSTQIYARTEEAYSSRTFDSGPVDLRPFDGDHTLRVIARNDFGQTEDSIIIHAPAPTITAEIRWPDAAIPPDRVGNSVRSVQVDVTVVNGISLEISNGDDTEVIALDESGPSDTRLVRLPRTGDLQVGTNTFEFRAINEFETAPMTLTLARRAHIFEVAGDAFLRVEASQQGIPAGDSVFVEATFELEDETHSHDNTWVVTQSLPEEADDAFLDFERYDFQFYQVVDGERQNVALNAIETAGALITGPDFQTLTLLYKPDPSWVLDNSPTNEVAPGLFSSVVTDHGIRNGGRMTIVAFDIETQQEVGADGD